MSVNFDVTNKEQDTENEKRYTQMNTFNQLELSCGVQLKGNREGNHDMSIC